MIDQRRAAIPLGTLFGALLTAFTLPPQALPSETLGVGSGLGDDHIPERPWQEQAAPLPGYPLMRNLIAVALPPRDTLKIYLDSQGLSRGEDGVARYVLVVVSPGGARNVLYEGIRCATGEYKTYAVGSADNTWRPLEEAVWRKIPYFESNAFRYHLHRHTLCDAHSSPRSPREILRALHAGLQE